MFFTFFSIAMGFSVHNSIAVLEGHIGRKSEFVRTPKFNVAENGKNNPESTNVPVKMSFQLLLEIFLLFYFIFAVISAFVLNNYSMILFHLMLVFGFGYVVFQSLNISKFFYQRKNLTSLQDL